MGKQMKKIFAWIMISAMLLSLIPAGITASAAVGDAITAGDIHYTVRSESPCAVAVTGYTGTSADLIIPASIRHGDNDYAVTKIGDYAFESCSGLATVTIPASVTTIGEGAFYDCAGLTSVTIVDSVTAIGDYAFAYCSGLTSVMISDSVTTIGNYAFHDCTKLTSVTIPDSVTTIGEGAFCGCAELTSVTIGDSVTKIGDYAFAYCSGLTSVTIPDSVMKIGSCAFNSTSSAVVNSNPFMDVKDGDFFYDPILWAVDKGITRGVTETAFCPYDITTRAQMVTFLWRAAGSPEPVSTTNPFADMNEDDYFYRAVLWGYENGYVEETSKITFSPELTVTFGQAVTFLARMAGETDEAADTPQSFMDVLADAYYNHSIAWASRKGIANGIGKDPFAPDQGCTRGEVVTVLYRYANQ